MGRPAGTMITKPPNSSRNVAAYAAKEATGGLATAGLVAAVLGLGTLNRVLYRLALVPLRDYVFFLAQAQNIGYLVIYFSLLALRFRQGKVTQAMLATPKPLFVLTGMCEAAAQLLMMSGAAHLPGALLPLLMQTVLLWNLLFSQLVFGTRPSLPQILGVLAVLAGVAVASWPSGSSAAAAAAAAEIQPLHLLLCVVSFAFPALATIIKERIFKDAARRLGSGQQLDVLVVNSYCSTAQAGFLLLLLPLTCHLKGLSLPELPAYLQSGTACLLGGSPACGADCTGAPLLPLLYITVNVAFNVAAMYLVRSAGAVATALSMSCLVPITVVAFTLPLPLLPQAQLGGGFVAGTLLLVAGLLTYNAALWLPAAMRLGRKWQAGLARG
ncbi:hypothetical protein OEZ86_004189 [Tetradesmus obliquus]|nr:hypothetical protein OEZ86_004189 [Tetradesmus obliquus]